MPNKNKKTGNKAEITAYRRRRFSDFHQLSKYRLQDLTEHHPTHRWQMATEAIMPAASAHRAAGRAWRVLLMPTLPK